MKSLAYKIIYKNKTWRENVLNDLERSDLDAASIKYQIAKENGISFENFKIYAIDPQDSTKVPLQDGQTLTDSYKIVQLYEEELLSGQRPRKTSSDHSLTFQQTSQLIVEKPMDFQQVQPVSPPYVYGTFKISRALKCFSKERYFQINPEVFVINIYQSKQKFPKKPELTIPILMISKITKLIKAPCFSNKSYMQIITPDNTITMSFSQKKICSEWIKMIKEAIIYAKFVQSKRASLKNNWRPTSPGGKVQLIDEHRDIDTFQRKSNKSQRSDPSQMLFSSEQFPVLFEHFLFQKKIGNGSFGLVYYGRHRETDKVVAIKQLNKDKLIHRHQLKYAITQLKILKQVKHPFIVTLYYAFQTKENLYLGITFCPNGSLKQLIQDNQKLSVEDAVLYICQIILAIQYLHKKKIIYRDLKPQNILMTSDYHICLSDFGLSKTDVDVDDYAESFLGTPAYLAPQMATNGRATQATDIYGIGVVMYQMLHGRMIFFGSHIGQILQDIQNAEPQIEQKLPKQVKSFLRCTLQKDPEKRIKRPKQHPLFKNINWNGIMKKKVYPKVKIHEERSSLEWDIRDQQIDQDYNQSNYVQNRVQGWVFSRSE